jgi:hypothetical protein
MFDKIRAKLEGSDESDAEKNLGAFVARQSDDILSEAVRVFVSRGTSVFGMWDNIVTFRYRRSGASLKSGIEAGDDTLFTIVVTPVEGGCRIMFGGERGSGSAKREFDHWLNTLR